MLFLVISINGSFDRNLLIESKIGESNQKPLLNAETGLNQKISGLTFIPNNSLIFIDDNGDFLAQGFTGTGDRSNPFLLYNRSITNSSGTLIHIQDTTSFFKIDNCLLDGINGTPTGIYLENVINGNISNTIIGNNSDGLEVFSSSNNTFSGNTIYNCSDDGAYLWGSGINNTFSGNTIYNCTDDGIYIRSENNTISNNNISECFSSGIQMTFSSYNNISDNTIFNCTYQGIAITSGGYNNISSNTFYNFSEDCIYMFSSSNNIISNNTIYNSFSGHGIRLQSSSNNNTVLDNDIYNCSDYGIYLWSSDNNTFTGNNVFNIGSYTIILFSSSDNNTFSGNNIFDSTDFSIFLTTSCNDNTFSFNNISDNNGGIYIGSSCNNNTFSSNIIFGISNDGIRVNLAVNTTLSGNTIYNCSGYGIYLITSNDTIISDNTIYDCIYSAIWLQSSSSNNVISGNTIYDFDTTGYPGIRLSSSSKNAFSDNSISNCSYYGIALSSSSNNNTFSGNTINNCSIAGFYLSLSDNNTFSGNTISNCTADGFYIDSSKNSTITDNMIYNCSGRGIYLEDSSNYNTITYNIIINNTDYGIEIASISNDNVVIFNSFLDNNDGGTSQAFDSVLNSNNNVSFNYWNEWTTPDIEPDGIVDNPYSIDGSLNEDLFPLTTPIFPKVIIISPLVAIYNTDTVIVELFGNSIIHYWYYIEGEDSLNQTWIGSENRTLTDGTYTLHAYGNNTFGNIDHTSVIFTVDFPHILSELEILTPNAGAFFEVITIKWNPTNDSHGHQIKYDLYYSSDNGNIWSLISTNRSGTTYSWNITGISDGLSYQVRIIAKCSGGTEIEVVSSIFAIDNDLIIPTSTTPNTTSGWNVPILIVVSFLLVIIRKRGKISD